ncbi:hypothetical protein [Lysobacter gummosus]|uniref:hypothetical protein n=1 Tax=Lysobacter gummosus TaxID=262324 RepID=UPI003638A8B5
MPSRRSHTRRPTHASAFVLIRARWLRANNPRLEMAYKKAGQQKAGARPAWISMSPCERLRRRTPRTPYSRAASGNSMMKREPPCLRSSYHS